ncbi:hypothetical protein A5747_13610 [Mycobacterium sp. IS-836]|uniref:hypothetical protein n=1 Tax=Mycobacterium sp. IS-836 TaxID=1834160 RepID=UPI00096C9DAB|nr:hypothetical protein [Mycobacterium sp. IS-836]OMC55421.1 hypothetical protein A5747_13610 [Mycobacterium sp. IS-836]
MAKHTVQINYRSGKSMVVSCESFKFKYNGSGLTSAEWEGMNPDPLYLNLDDIESIWQFH